MEKNDIHHIEQTFLQSIKATKNCKTICIEDKKKIQQFVSDCLIGKHSRKKVGKYRIVKYLDTLRLLSQYFKKPFVKITEKDIEEFYRKLEINKIKKKNKKAYANPSKNEFVSTLKRFGKWFYKDNLEKYQKIFGWLKDFEEDIEVPALKKEEVEKLAKTSNVRDAALLMFMFDSGARAEELLNIKLEDLREEQIGKDLFYKVRIKISKTKPRTITIPLVTPYLKNWLAIHPTKEDKSSFLFPTTYAYLRKILYRKGKILGKRVYAHLFRHSSATYYCNKLNQYQLCYRYGWAMSSRQPQRYIDREGIEEEKTAKIITTDEITRFKEENEKLKEELIMLKAQYSGMESRLEEGFIKKLMLLEENQMKLTKILRNSKKGFEIVLPLNKQRLK